MSQRVSYYDVAPDGLKIMMDMEKYTKKSAIHRTTRELIKIRVSQMNGCAYCIDTHCSDARKMGETEQRIYCLHTWDECDFYTPAEKAALELSEHITLIPTKRVPEPLYHRVREHYNEKQYVDLVLIINQINSWNRISIAMGNKPAKNQNPS
ncbi:alkylhydroperoxidase AhpD family core domain-containing protein [Terribacillus halophilus]|uniref:Alkylhydroperoxidase AhpD family core domain-containing protein n=1 Tax=Terribacillus halophilus TaxID=361279 RepID=A0A1G6PQ16_9BACI|nr:carboxymuconolactone decarboxylase family protein [Terribacillus halophilus]SDC82342.1 alkylhydroperoxidase AhpD family core domain-containing protein [Terribacillus halophilus]